VTANQNATNLRDALRDLLALLEEVRDQFWSEKVRAALERRIVDPREVLSWFGGMGSLNDLIISPLNGHVVAPDQEGPANQQLDDVRSSIYRLATVMGAP
jgi:hypothetical protein